ncbi:hypothetical protein KUTeg_013296 [Tegillarca granosa]|uniref:Glycoside hydrolase family 65 central catalytic domain-containing protein n=1 Tax=Tegillarca granosa TaxID=220873 RepID=A0ABQ9ETB4_TEGGR|nr:hypothetical protein KUTeg_013296 [Tegillarca granosa]
MCIQWKNDNGERQQRKRNEILQKTYGRENSYGEYVTLVYGNERRVIQKPKNAYPDFLDPDVTILSTNSLPFFTKLLPTIGNGYIATVVKSDTIYRSDLFTGYNVTSHRARIPATSNIELTFVSEKVTSLKYSLDMGRGMYIEEYKGEHFDIQIKMYAHRVLKGVLVTDLTVNTTVNLTVKLQSNPGRASQDLQIVKNSSTNESFSFQAEPKQQEYNSAQNDAYVTYSKVPRDITFKSFTTTSHLFLTVISNDEGSTKDYLYEAYVAFMNGSLETSHTNAWIKSWEEGRIDLTGNIPLARVTYASYYYILSSVLPPDPDILVKPWPFVGLSPGDLAHGALGRDYAGHVFWDQETWMYPPVLMLHSEMGKVILERLEVCPGEKFARYEQHITGDIAFALKQYYMMSNDTDFIQNGRGGELINEIANYWTSRVVYNEQKQLYEIPGVMPPDEFHSPVNNSAYTNVVAKISLLMTKDILPLINMNSTKFEEIGNKMYIPFDESAKFHPEYDGYKLGTIIKQADVILLGFPLMQNLTTEVRKNDLTIYEKVTPGGPAMTWGMFAIGWIELGDMTKAEELFKRQMLNVNKPFNVWSEVPLGLGALNFITGSGGYLQSLIFGYGGFRIREDKLEFNGNLPPNVTCFNITGVDYLQGSLSFSFWDYGMSVKQTKTAKTNLMVVLDFSGEKTLLTVGRTVSYGLVHSDTIYRSDLYNGYKPSHRARIPSMCAVNITKISDSEITDKKYSLDLGRGEVGYIEGNLELLHVKAWEKEWKNGRIDLSGNPDLTKTTYASLYYLMSSMLPPDQYILTSVWPFVGLSPGDLAHGSKGKDYEGHVFWDQETWMYPPLLMLQSEWAKIILNSRIRTLNAAKSIASKGGYKGAMFPWESAFTGFEVCPEDVYSKYEQHINGDIALAVKQYFMMTNDTNFIINDVMPPDEYHAPVNNSVYTNAIAQISLLMTKDILPLINVSTTKFEEIGNKMLIPFIKSKNWHPEYDGYKEGTVVKQADVILLGFPLMLNMSKEVRKNDLLMYEKVWSELPSGNGAVNFITGMGGYLQSLIFGYGGFRMLSDRLEFNANLPPDVTNYNISGLDYFHGSFDFHFWDKGMNITQTKEGNVDFDIVLASSGVRYALTVDKTITFDRQKASICKQLK